MAAKLNFQGGRIILGTGFAGYKFGIFEAGSSTPKTTYTDSALTAGNENTHPVTLDANGAAQIWFSGNAKAIFYTPANVTVYTDDSINLEDSTDASGEFNSVLNSSFEIDTDGNGIPENWDRTLYTNGTFSLDTTTQAHGDTSAKFTSTGSGGGYLTSSNNFSVSPLRKARMSFSLKGTADVRNVVEVIWYKADGTASATASTTVYDDSATNPTSWTRKHYNVSIPSDAYFAKVRLTGCHSSDSTAGSTWFDDVVFTDAATIEAPNKFEELQTFIKGIGQDYLQNVRISPSVGSNALTVALKGNDGSDPSSTNIVEAAFRSTTATSGAYNVRQITSATSITVPQGGTLGFSGSETGYVYVYLCDDGSTRAIGVAKKALFDEGYLHTTTAVGTGSDDGSTLYTPTLMTSAAVRLLGRITIATGATPGDWGSSPTKLEPWYPGMKKTGDVIQVVYTQTGAVATGTTVILDDDTIPQNNEGDEYMTLAFTRQNTLNTAVVESSGFFATSGGGTFQMSLFRDSVADALAAHIAATPSTGATIQGHLNYTLALTGLSAVTFKIRAGFANAGTTTFNGTAAARKLGGVMNSFMKVTEICA